jgi:hypothetical protein
MMRSNGMFFLTNSLIMTANAASYLQVGPSEAGGFSHNITVRICRQTGNEAGVLVIMRGIGLWDNAWRTMRLAGALRAQEEL